MPYIVANNSLACSKIMRLMRLNAIQRDIMMGFQFPLITLITFLFFVCSPRKKKKKMTSYNRTKEHYTKQQEERERKKEVRKHTVFHF